MAYRMQSSVPELTDLSKEPRPHLRALRPRRAQARHVRLQLPAGAAARRARRAFHPALSPRLGPAQQPAASDRGQCRDTDQPSAALIGPEERGLLDDTLVVWGGEFGRTVYCQGKLTPRRLRPRSPSALLHHLDGRRRHQAGHHVSARPTTTAYNITRDPVHVHDLQRDDPALPGHRPHRLTYKFQGRHFRLTDVHGDVVQQVLA